MMTLRKLLPRRAVARGALATLAGPLLVVAAGCLPAADEEAADDASRAAPFDPAQPLAAAPPPGAATETRPAAPKGPAVPNPPVPTPLPEINPAVAPGTPPLPPGSMPVVTPGVTPAPAPAPAPAPSAPSADPAQNTPATPATTPAAPMPLACGDTSCPQLVECSWLDGTRSKTSYASCCLATSDGKGAICGVVDPNLGCMEMPSRDPAEAECHPSGTMHCSFPEGQITCPALWVSSSVAGSTYESGCCGTQTNWSDAQGAPLSVTTPYCGIPSGNEYCVPSTFAPAGTLQPGTVRAPTAACVPSCAGKTCGQSDGCGNTCAGSCGDARYSCIPGPGTCTDGQPCLQHYCAIACQTDSDCCQIEAYDGQVQYGGLCCMPFNGTHVCGKSESYICPVRSVDICGNLLGDL